ncbi:MAG: type II toxin-antitoxin system RelE/ParE family toxin [Candidatus Kapaibacteriales bacterium]
MRIVLKESFVRDFKALKNNKPLIRKADDFIQNVSKAKSIRELSSIKKINGAKNHYRYRIGDYRLAFTKDKDTLILSRFLHRNKIYKEFP